MMAAIQGRRLCRPPLQDLDEPMSVTPPLATLPPGAHLFVTGAAGGLGAHVARVCLEAGYQVTATDLIPFEASALYEELSALYAAGQLRWVRADLSRLQGAAFDALVEGVDAVIHAAAIVSLSEDDEDFVKVNVEAVRALYEACQRQGVRRFVHYSCGSLYKTGGGMLTEQSPLEAQNGYERSKLDAELALRQATDQERCAWTILRPGMLYGPYCHTMGAALVTLPPIMHRFISYLPGLTGGPRQSWCHAEDAASAALTVLGDERSFGQIYNVADPTPLGFGELLTSMMEAYGLDVVGPLVPFPSAALQLALPLLNRDVVFDQLRTVMRQLWRRVLLTYGLESPLRPRVDREALFYASGDSILETSALGALGWKPKYHDCREGIVPTIRWYQERGWVPRYDSHTLMELRERERTRGFGFNEALQGRWVDDMGAAYELILDLDVEFPPVSQLVARFYGVIDGTITIKGLLDEAPLEGTLAIDWFGDARATYEFGFKDRDGHTRRFCGYKELSWRHPIASAQRLDGVVVDQHGRQVATASLMFQFAQQWVPLLVSLRFLTGAQEETQQR